MVVEEEEERWVMTPLEQVLERLPPNLARRMLSNVLEVQILMRLGADTPSRKRRLSTLRQEAIYILRQARFYDPRLQVSFVETVPRHTVGLDIVAGIGLAFVFGGFCVGGACMAIALL